MMKVKVLLSTLLLVATFGGITTTVTPAQADASQTKLKTFPTKLRGTWYHYYGKKIGLHKMVITKHHLKVVLKSRKKTVKGTLMKYRYPGKWATYVFSDKANPFDTASWVPTKMTIKGKAHPILAELQQDDAKPWAYTHFNPGKHQYMAPYSTLHHLY